MPGPGGSHAQLVIRSYNSDPSLDNVPPRRPTSGISRRPGPQCCLSSTTACWTTPSGHLRGDAATYSLIVERDRGQFPTVDDVPIEPAEQLTIPYFPDPLARGAAFAGLPHAPADTDGVISGGVLSYQPSADVVPLTGTVTMVSFGSGWPDLQAFRIRLAEGTGLPSWEDPSRVLTVPLAKAETRDGRPELLPRPVGPRAARGLGMDPRAVRVEPGQRASERLGWLRTSRTGRQLSQLTRLVLRRRRRDDHAAASGVVRARRAAAARPPRMVPAPGRPQSRVAPGGPVGRERVLEDNCLAVRGLAHGCPARCIANQRCQHRCDRRQRNVD